LPPMQPVKSKHTSSSFLAHLLYFGTPAAVIGSS
jgi:hypothetical protein